MFPIRVVTNKPKLSKTDPPKLENKLTSIQNFSYIKFNYINYFELSIEYDGRSMRRLKRCLIDVCKLVDTQNTVQETGVPPCQRIKYTGGGGISFFNSVFLLFITPPGIKKTWETT